MIMQLERENNRQQHLKRLKMLEKVLVLLFILACALAFYFLL